MRGRRTVGLLVAIAMATGAAACGGDDDAAEAPPTTADAPAETAPAGPPAAEPPTSEQICAALDGPAVAAVIGTPVTETGPQSSATPGCYYEFERDDTRDGVVSSVAVAVMRPDEDLGGRTGAAGVEHVLERNRALAEGTPESALEVGEGGTLMEGTSLTLAVVDLGGPVMMVVAPVDDLDAETVRALAPVAAGALAP